MKEKNIISKFFGIILYLVGCTAVASFFVSILVLWGECPNPQSCISAYLDQKSLVTYAQNFAE